MHNQTRKNTIRRKSDDELDDDLRPSAEIPDTALPRGSDLINERFVAFAGNPNQLNDVASLASAGLVIAEQLAELTTAVHTLTFLLVTDERRT